MVPPVGDGRSPAPIDRSILNYLRERLDTTRQVQQAIITDDNGHLELRVEFATAYYPETVLKTTLSVRWYTNDDFKIHYREARDGTGNDWECRWDRHPNTHNTRDHFHPPPDAPTPAEDASSPWPTDYREVITLVFEECEQRIATLWDS